jgi:hypothetical protein
MLFEFELQVVQNNVSCFSLLFKASKFYLQITVFGHYISSFLIPQTETESIISSKPTKKERQVGRDERVTCTRVIISFSD